MRLVFFLCLLSAPLASGVAAQGFDIQHSLQINHISEKPQLSPDGSRVAFVYSDWQDDASVKAHKPTGKLVIKTSEGADVAQLSDHASDPVWSRSGQLITYFEGTGAHRHLVISKTAPGSVDPIRIAIPGEPSRYSGLSFAPVWGPSDQYIVTAEAVNAAEATAVIEPYSITSATAQLPNDAHFRSSMLWRVIRLNLSNHTKDYLTPPLALREMFASPLGASFVLSVARQDVPGVFLGDDFTLPIEHRLLSLTGASSLQALGDESLGAILGWRSEESLLIRSTSGLGALNISTGDLTTLSDWPFEHSSKGFNLSASHLAVWGNPQTVQAHQYVIPPATADIMTVMQLGNGIIQEVIGAADNQEILQAFWLQSEQRLLIHTRDLQSFNERILIWTSSGMQTVFEAAVSIGPISSAGNSSNLAFPLEDAVNLPELQILNPDSSQLKTISNLNQQITRFFSGKGGFVAPEIISGAGPEGTAWRALLYLPPRAKSGQATSLVVSSYGRQTDRLNQFNAEAQMHTGLGYAYLLPDVFPLRGQLHRAYVEVIPSAIAAVREQFELHGRTGYFGGSLGAYAGLVLISRTALIDAAVLRAAPSEFAMSWATGKDRDADLLEYLMLNKTPFQSMDAYREDSPFWMADKVTAATLLLHGTDDAQVPLEQSEWMFQSLRRVGKAVAELRIYPGADHSIVRGNSAYYQDYYQQLFAWWQRYLQTADGAAEQISGSAQW